MATFVYAPAIRVHIRSDKNGIIDISDDIVNWELTRRSNTVSSFQFTLQNSQRKYDGAFLPGDAISVELKRITWVRVFTGTLNNVPIFSAWPRALPMSASCTLKTLQFWPWDPTSQAAVDLVSHYTNSIVNNNAAGDGGLSALVRDSLHAVTGWDPKRIHIGAVPNAWYKWAQSTEKDITTASDMAAVLGPGTVAGSVGSLKIPAGNYGGHTLTADQVDIASQIYAAVITTTMEMNLSTALQDRAATVALMVAADESSLSDPKSATDHTSLGPFQQQDWWGTATQREDVTWSTNAFLKGSNGNRGLFDVKDWKTNPNLPMVAQTVQGSAYSTGLNYLAWQDAALALVKKLRSQLVTAISSGTSAGGNLNPIAGNVASGVTGKYAGTGTMIGATAQKLITSHPAGYIRYQTPPPGFSPQMADPRVLDCSALVSWVQYQVTGNVVTAQSVSQWDACKIRNIPFDVASAIQGCWMFGTGSGSGTGFGNSPDHVGISLGDGTHVAAHTDGIALAKQVDIESLTDSGLALGALAPGIDYTAAATTEKARAWLQANGGQGSTSISKVKLSDASIPATTGNPGVGTTDPFSQLVTSMAQSPVIGGNVFGGARELINNQPFLPWITNLTNSSMRTFCSAPNGDFIAWFPDYFNVWGTAAVMKVKLIELQDFTVEWTDQQIVTHEFVIGTNQPLLDNLSGSIQPGAADIGAQAAMIKTEGIATMNFPQIFETIYGKTLPKGFVGKYLERFGARPNLEQFPNILQGPQEFYMALWRFMKHWSEQFNATVPMTFMPELWPGMLLQIDEYKFQAYISEVTHRGSYGPQGQFTTEAKIIAPGSTDPNVRASLFGILDRI